VSGQDGVRLRTEGVPPSGIRFTGARVAEPRLAKAADRLVYVLNPPAARRFGPLGQLADMRPARWALTEEDGDVVLTAESEAEVDLLELGGDAGEAFERDRPEAMTIVPDFEPLGGARDLGRYLVGGKVLTGTESIKKPIDSTALSLYRTARLRGGPFWDDIAGHVAEAEAARIEALADRDLPHDMWSAGETHIRFVNDALLTMTAHAEWSGDERFVRAAAQVCGVLDRFTVDAAGGRWILHDSLERDDGHNDVVLNTHVQAVIALLSAGREVDAELRATGAVLEPKLGGPAGIRSAAAISLVEGVRAIGPRRTIRRRVSPTYKRVALRCQEATAMRLPGGWIARDLSGRRAPGRYLTVNLGDIAALLACEPPSPGRLREHLDDGLNFAKRSGFFRAEIRDATPMSVLIPAVLRLAGRNDEAKRVAEKLLDAGMAPLVGWPGYEDALWDRLGDGAPL
jgi:hypothetical protein